jgi:uncharacterized membrane protein
MSLVPKAPAAQAQPALVFNTPTRWILRVLSWLAFLIAAYLAWGSITNTPIAGCGVGTHAGCDAVLNSPWAKWIVVPVSVAGLACYAGLAGLSVLLGIRDPRAGRWITTAFVMLATVAAGASLWFIALQIFAIGEFCWYCLATDVCGIAIGALTAWSVFSARNSMPRVPRAGTSSAQLAALRSALPAGSRPAPVPSTSPKAAPAPSPLPAVVRPPAPPRPTTALPAFPSLPIAYGGAVALLLVLIVGQVLFRDKTYEVQQVDLTTAIDMSGNGGRDAADPAAQSDNAANHVAMRIPAEEGNPTEEAADEAALTDGNGQATAADSSPDRATNGEELAAESVSPSTSTKASENSAAQVSSPPPKRERKVKLLNGKLTLDVYKQAYIGNPEAPHVVAELISYNCPHCRKTNRLMKQAMSRYGDQVCLVVLIIPMEQSCNRLFKNSEGSHPGACTTARMALGVAKLKPESFGRFHDFLMSGNKDKPPSLDTIISKAYSTVDRNRLRKLRESKELEPQIASTIDLYDSLSKQHKGKKSFGLPVQIVGNEVTTGGFEKSDEIYKLWEKNLDVKPR